MVNSIHHLKKNDGSNKEFEKVEESYINKKEISVNVGNDFEIYSGYDSAISDRNYSLIEKDIQLMQQPSI